MRILFVSGCYLPTTNGVTYHIQLLKKALEKRGHMVFLLAPYSRNFKDTEKNILRYPSLPNPIFPNFPIGLPIYPLKNIKNLNIEVVHTHHPFVAGSLATQIAESLNIPLYWTNHTRYEEYFNHYLPSLSGLSRKALSAHLRDLSIKCQKVICPSSIAVTILKSYGIKNTHIAYNGIDTANFIPNPKFRDQNLHLLYVGRLEKEKNIHFLIDIARHLHKLVLNFHLSIIGDGKEFNLLNQKIQLENLTKNITLTGSLPRPRLINYYQKANLFISPSTTEVMPLTFIEALSSGLPIICLKKSGVDKFLPKDPSIIPLNPNPKKIAQYISKLNNLDRLSESARKLGEKFDVSQTAIELEELYGWHTGQK